MHSREIMTRLKFISKIKIGDKINTRHHLSIQPNNFLTRISRTIILQDSRTNALLFISDTINSALELIESIRLSEKPIEVNLLTLLLEDLYNSKIGIKNLSETYMDDLILVSNFETIIQNVDFILNDLKVTMKQHSQPIEITTKLIDEDTFHSSASV